MIDILRKSYVALTVLALALIAQIPHAAYVFDHIAGDLQEHDWTVLGYSYAIALELAVLMFVVHGKQAESYGFAFASVLVNLSYYAMHSVDLWSMQAFPAWLIAFMLPVGIARYSHIIAEVDDVQVNAQWLQVAWLQVREVVGLQRNDVAPVAQIEDSATMPVQDANVQDLQPVVQKPQPVKAQGNATLDGLRAKAQELRAQGGMNLDEIASQVGKSASWVSRNTEAVNA